MARKPNGTRSGGVLFRLSIRSHNI
ncbi:protein of unknown function [Sterolibacterium denitrificans]|uniref:Uncharacterized protein n=1 Tax=Sterolibacterium denitrificans TaxID=157592 RepID=A0A7Z7MW81_9PROT|nr:protein of unknown function [Sterolibacterium denitrificans]